MKSTTLHTMNIKKITKAFFALLIVLSSMNKAHATHAAGADLTYICLGGNQYRIEVTFYRDCGGIAEPSNITVSYKSISLGQNLTVTANKITGTGQEITVPCATSASTCNGGTSTGIRKFVYQATVTLPAPATDWKFSYGVCCRNCAITSIMNPCSSSTEIYVESTLNNVAAPGNSSPVFSNIPIAFVCSGQNFNYNHGVSDVNGDSLSYQFIAPKINGTTNVTFVTPFTATTPFSSSTPFSLNALTGQISFTPNMVQVGIMAIQVKEYRNGVLIGSVIRDMEVFTNICANTLPTASGINNTANYTMTACANQQVCFNVFSNDADVGQNVTVTTNSGIAAGTYSISGGSKPTLNFCWTPTLADIDLSPQTFIVTVKDNACPTNGIQTFSYSINVVAPDFNITSSNVSCFGLNNGIATANPVYGGAQTYLWSTGATTASISNLAPGAYTATLTNSNGCTITKSVTISQPALLSNALLQTNISCAGLCNGAITLTVSGGTTPYSYIWTGGNTTQNISGKCIGTYTVIVTDTKGCTVTKSTTLTNVSNIAVSLAGSNVSCFAGNSGTVVLTVSGGVTPYSYLWSNGSPSKDLNSITAGTYTVTVTDGNACTKTSSVIVTQPAAALNSSVTTSANVSCFGGNNGAIDLTVSGGTGPYSYNWSNGNSNQDLSNISSGAYTVTVTDNKGCTSIVNAISITQPASPLNTSAGTIANVSCFGGINGSITLTVNGGTSPYAFNWSNGATSQNLSNIASGTYTVTVTDAKGCTISESGIQISQPSAALSSNVSFITSVFCYGGNNGNINLNVNGGTGPYSYNWSNGNTSQNLSNVVAGTYSVTVTDAKGCTVSNAGLQISQPAAALNSNAGATTSVSCFGGNNGSINLSVSGGSSPYTYIWNNGSTNQNLINIPAGSYTVVVTDNKGCTKTVSGIAITQPAASLNAVVNTTADVLCFGGSSGAISINVNGGTSPYSYLWSNGTTTQNLPSIVSGTYTVNINDAKGCTRSISGVSISQPSAVLDGNINHLTNLSCFGNSSGAIDLSVTGGTTPYTYLWNNGINTQDLNNVAAGIYSVTITDANGCTNIENSILITQPAGALIANATTTANVNCASGANGAISLSVSGGTAGYTFSWNNGATTQNISGLYAGTYVVTVIDNNGCSKNASATVSQPVGSLNSAINTSQNVSCFGGNNGSVNVTINGGTAPYNYAWNNGATTQNLNGLPSGGYTVTITDNNGCINIAATVVNQPSAPLSNTISALANVSCFGDQTGAVDFTANGGTTPYTYLWSNGTTSEDQSTLAAGTYTVTVTDAKGCTLSAAAIAISQPSAAITSSVSSLNNVSCNGGTNGGITLSVNGGTSPYSYGWSNGASSQNLGMLAAGIYTVTITDSKGCSKVVSGIAVTQPAALSGNISVSANISCFGGNNGSIDLTTNGGTAPYSYNWSNGNTTQNITNLLSATYTVTITDVKGCTTQIAGVNINQPGAALSGNPSAIGNVNCFGGNNGSISLTVSGGTLPYTYQWNNGATAQAISNLAAGAYTATVTDAKGCSTQIAGINVSQPGASLAANTTSISNVNCFSGNNGNINLNVIGGTAPYLFQWSNGSTSQNISNLNAGNYSVTVTDAKGCITQVLAIGINEPAAPLSANTTSIANVNCFGGNNGNINLNVIGGTTPYSYQWSNGTTSQNIANLNSGTYTVTVTDNKGCTDLISAITISQPGAALSGLISSQSDVNCFGGNNGIVNLNISGGTTPYAYLWSNGTTSQNLNNVIAGSYSVTVTDLRGCTMQIAGIKVGQPGASITSNASSTNNVSCYGGNNGNINLTTSGGTLPYSYIWSNGSTSQNINNLSSGTYSATITDANGCTTQVTGIAVTQPGASLSANPSSVSNVNCFGGNNGNINLSVIGGTSPYTYLWNNGLTTQNLNNLISGTYTVTVTDAKGCITQISGIAINQPAAAVTANASSTANVSCYGGNNGNINLNVNGGTAPYTYQWNNGATNQNLSGLASGTYTSTITDANGCATQVNGITINQPGASVTAAPSSITYVSCFSGNNGAISLTVNGGTSPYTFLWNNGATIQHLTSLASGTYSVTVTDINGCSVSVNAININQPGASVQATPSATTNVNCFGGNSGTINLSVNGGTAPYIYQWSNGATTQNLNGLSSGNYTVSVTDANGCSTQVTGIAINQPGAAVSAAPASTNAVSCFGGNNGNINLTVNGGTSPYSYQWNNGSTNQNIANLISGTYTAIITDANGCTTQVSGISINQPGAAVTAAPSAITSVSCYGGNNGTITLNVNGGTLPYTYQWNTGATTQSMNNIASGTYTVTVTDSNGCTTQTNGIAVNQPGASVQATPSSTANVSCFGGNNGNININVNGGTAPYLYLWSNGTTTQNVAGLPSGTYTVNVTDFNGCTTQVAGIAIAQPGASVSAVPTSTGNVSCYGGNNGAINLAVNGGTLPYVYQWNTGASTQNLSNLNSGTYTATVTDINGCSTQVAGIAINQPGASVSAVPSLTGNVNCFGGNNGNINIVVNGGTLPYTYLWNNGATTQNVNSLASATYTVTVTDVNGCSNEINAININQPTAAVQATPSSTNNVSCFGGNNGDINLNVNGGTAPYSYQWNNGATTQNLSNLASGTYTTTVTDANGCTTQVASIAVNQPGASLNGVVTTTQNVSCNSGGNGTILLTANGGTAPYSYLWSNGQTTQNLTGLYSGSYVVTITDVMGCTFSDIGIVSQPSGALASSINVAQNINCYGGNNGSINLAVSGGTSPYLYSWSNGATSQNLTGLAAGSYSVTITDVNGCLNITYANVQQPSGSLNGNPNSTTNVSCYGGNNGDIVLNVNGGTNPYAYQWSNGETTQNLSNLASGTYTATVTDANGCTTQVSGIAINQPGASVSATPGSTTNVNCYGGNNGVINLNVNGGTSPYSYQWNNGATTQSLNNLVAGTYTATVTDVNGCYTTVAAIAINQPGAAVSALPSSTTNVSCYGGNNGDITLNVNGGTVPYSYQWSNGETTQDLNSLPSGTYTVTVTDANGCTTQIAGIAINQPGATVTAAPASSTNVNCFGGNNGDINLTVNGGTMPYTYLWNNGATTQNINNLAAATYTVTVTDINGCSTQVAGMAINQPGAVLTANPNSTSNVSCYGGNNGDITLVINGGTLPYNYQWSNGETTQDINNLTAGTYSVTITDMNGCTTQVAGIAVNQPGAVVNASPTSTTNVSCYGGNNGDINLTVNGGTAPYTFQWSNGETTQSLSNLPTGTYTATVTDANGCSIVTGGITINQPNAALAASPSTVTQVNCTGGNNGFIDITVNGGTLPYTYQWSNGASTQSISYLPAGTYTATVTDINGCSTVIAGIAVNQPATLVSANPDSIVNILCFGANSGSISISANGGTLPYNYQWSNGSTNQNINNINAGNYTVTITDANGCITQIAGIAVTAPALLAATANFISGIDCFGGKDGEIDLTITGGTAPYTFIWSNGTTTQNNTYLPAGTYTATITDINGCSTIASSVVILQPAAPLTTVVSASQNIICYGSAIGLIDLSTSNGTAPYTYLWNNGLTTEDVNGLTAGVYTATIIDSHGCTTTVSATITQPAAGLSVNGTVSNANCLFGITGSVNIITNGGTSPYSYLWNTGGVTQNISNVGGGSYSVTITDANGCSSQGSYNVIDNSAFNANADGPTEFCVGGSVTLTSDSVVAANYQWYLNGLPISGANGNTYTAAVIGNYSVTVINNCGSFSSMPITVNVHNSDSIMLSPDVFVCAGESAQINVSGGTSYEWLPVTGLNSSNIADPVVTPIANTTYIVIVTNDYGCKSTDSINVEIRCDTLIIPTGYSPNSDGTNDYFVIPGIDKYPGNKIWIYNRWGSLVYETQNYDNKWGGMSNAPGLYIGQKVPASTYFYVLDLNDGTKPRQGYIVIRY